VPRLFDYFVYLVYDINKKEKHTMKKYSIYIIRNKKNEKVYIGQTCNSIEERFRQHMKPSTIKKRGSYKIYNAISKYGSENFYCELLEGNIKAKDVDEKEIYYIELYNSYYNGYNSTHGGDSKTISKIQDVDLLIKLFEDNYEYQEIANEFNVCKETVVRTLRSIGLKRNNKISEEYLINNTHKTNIEIANEFNVDPMTVGRAFKKYDIKRGTGCSNKLNKQNMKKQGVTTIPMGSRADNNHCSKC
jgi:group I intron endonuclease